MKNKKNLKYILLILIVLSTILTTSILMIYVIGHKSLEKFYQINFTNIYKNGYPRQEGHFIKFRNAESNIISNIFVDKNTLRLRTTKTSKSHIILTGGSNLSGWRMDKNKTIFDILTLKDALKNVDIINFSYPGWGPNNILYRFEQLPFESISKTKYGFLVYFFFDLHFERVCGSDEVFEWSQGLSPYYTKVNNKLQFQSLYYQTKKYKRWLFKNGYRKIISFLSGTKVNYQQNMWKSEDKKCLNLFFTILQNIKSKYKSIYPKGKFVITSVNYLPDTTYKNELMKISDIYINLRDIIDNNDKADIFQEDHHINEHFNKLYVDRLLNQLNE